jgi:L-alanine-DL-glutamate epimerase-like enolase superfamily enzyme
MVTFRIHELAKYIDWWQDLVMHEGPIIDGGYLTIQDKPEYGVELNPDTPKHTWRRVKDGGGELHPASIRLL